ncbi:MAG: hypothetical protein WC686_04540 [Candidatus Shapirobacteria bacterium]|jgi:hypothetical protein
MDGRVEFGQLPADKFLEHVVKPYPPGSLDTLTAIHRARIFEIQGLKVTGEQPITPQMMAFAQKAFFVISQSLPDNLKPAVCIPRKILAADSIDLVAKSPDDIGHMTLGISGIDTIWVLNDGGLPGYEFFNSSFPALSVIRQAQSLAHEIYHYSAPHRIDQNGIRVLAVPRYIEEGMSEWFADTCWPIICQFFPVEAHLYSSLLTPKDGYKPADCFIAGVSHNDGRVKSRPRPYIHEFRQCQYYQQISPDFIDNIQAARMGLNDLPLRLTLAHIDHLVQDKEAARAAKRKQMVRDLIRGK